MSKVRLYAYDGEKHTLIEWAELYGIPVHTLRARIKRTGSLEMALNTNARRSKKKFERNGL